MKKLLVLFSLLFLTKAHSQAPQTGLRDRYVLVIHGGAGTILRSQMTPDQEKAYTRALDSALDKGYAILARGGSALDAVELAVRVLEDNLLFNAGRGAVFTSDGKNELDAAIMDGKTLAAGSVAGVTTIRNPISAARAVMEKSVHVMMVGKGAEQFAASRGLDIVDPSYFYTEDRWKGLQRAKKRDSATNFIKAQKESQLACSEMIVELHKDWASISTIERSKRKAIIDSIEAFTLTEQVVANRWNEVLKESDLKTSILQPNADYKYGTVGAVALDRHGNLAAATSTGGMTNKQYGRVGDAPIIGAGTYANNATVAISGTGWGEYFIRLVMAKSISDMMEFGKWSLDAAAKEMIMKRLPALGGDGGLIAVDKNGNISMPFCTEGMYRGYIRQAGTSSKPVVKREVKIYKD